MSLNNITAAVVGFHFHKWSQWKQETGDYISYGPFWAKDKQGVHVTIRMQTRHCLICNKEQREEVSGP